MGKIKVDFKNSVFSRSNFQLKFGVYGNFPNFPSFLFSVNSSGKLRVKRCNAVDAEPEDFYRLLLRIFYFLLYIT